MDLRLTPLVLVALVALAPGCNYRAHVGAHDGGRTDSCSADSDCAAGNQCACGRCISLDLPAPACDPSCDSAAHGDFCTEEGRSCPTGSCSALVCRMGVMQHETGGCLDGGGCECPAPPPGCYYDSPSPCMCTNLVCPGEPCGRTTCGGGTVCCNESCGVCAPPGVACSTEICAPDCSPQDAQGGGFCGRALGIFAWNGWSCQELQGCDGCVGADCASTFRSQMECEAVFSECGRACGGFAGDVCNEGEYCDFREPHLCGATDEQGRCQPAPGICPPELLTVCGCDGNTYSSPCDATQSGTDVLREGPCEASCAPDDARGVGDCDGYFGSAWTGTRCQGVTGCSCEGSDCDLILRSQEDCARAHGHCIVPHD